MARSISEIDLQSQLRLTGVVRRRDRAERSGLARQRVDRWFRDLGIKPLIYAQVAGNEAIVSMVSLGFGIGVVPEIVLDASPLAGQVAVLRVTPALAPYEVGLFTLEKKLRSPLIQAFWAAKLLES